MARTFDPNSFDLLSNFDPQLRGRYIRAKQKFTTSRTLKHQLSDNRDISYEDQRSERQALIDLVMNHTTVEDCQVIDTVDSTTQSNVSHTIPIKPLSRGFRPTSRYRSASLATRRSRGNSEDNIHSRAKRIKAQLESSFLEPIFDRVLGRHKLKTTDEHSLDFINVHKPQSPKHMALDFSLQTGRTDARQVGPEPHESRFVSKSGSFLCGVRDHNKCTVNLQKTLGRDDRMYGKPYSTLEYRPNYDYVRKGSSAGGVDFNKYSSRAGLPKKITDGIENNLSLETVERGEKMLSTTKRVIGPNFRKGRSRQNRRGVLPYFMQVSLS